MSLPNTGRSDPPDISLDRDEARVRASDATQTSGHSSISVPPRLEVPTVIGPYHVGETLGEGGMGIVFKAQQFSPIQRTVALKLVRTELDARHVMARFEAERQALARMDHPNIAKVLDAGADPQGRPFFVMELVPGVPITKFCDENLLSISDRLALFLQICDAITHAHTKAILHRDIKASNVLAYRADGVPTVKVIDFGIAKALREDDRLSASLDRTVAGHAIGTYDSMSPEQAQGEVDVDTRTDVYALGVLLYELLCGAKPLSHVMKPGLPDLQLQRIILEQQPPRPSERLASSDDSRFPEMARARKTTPAELLQQLQAELEWIPMMAVRKERDRRYASVSALAQDIRNYLSNRPLIAGPDSRRYRLAKFARRNRAPLIAAAAVTLALIGGVAGTTFGLIREARQRQEAQRQTTRAEHALAAEAEQRHRAEGQTAVAETALTAEARERQRAQARFADVRQLANDFMFQFDDSLRNVAGTTPARKMLADTASRYLDRISGDVAGDRLLSRELAFSYKKVGDIQGNPNMPNTGNSDQALASYRKSIDIERNLLHDDPDNPAIQRELAQVLQSTADVLLWKGDPDGARKYIGSAMSLEHKLLGGHPQDKDIQNDLISAYTGLGKVQQAHGEIDQAMQSFQASLDMSQKMAAREPGNANMQRNVSFDLQRIGDIQFDRNQYDQALKAYEKSAAILEKLLDADPHNAGFQRDMAVAYVMVGDAKFRLQQDAEALLTYQKSQEICQRLATADPGNALAQRDLALGYINIGDIYSARGQRDAALPYYVKSLESAQRASQDDPTSTLVQYDLGTSYGRIAEMQAALGRFDEAMVDVDHCVDVFKNLVHIDPTNSNHRQDLVASYQRRGRIQFARGDVDQSLESFDQMLKIRTDYAQRFPGELGAQRELAESRYSRASFLCRVAASPALPLQRRLTVLQAALVDYRSALEFVNSLKSSGTLTGHDKAMPGILSAAIHQCNEQIAQLEKQPATKPAR